MSSAWKGRRSGHSASAGSATATACSATDVTSAATSAAATATGTAAAATAGIVASACGVRLLGGSFSLASPDASASSRVSTRFCCCTSDAIERSSPALEAEGRLVVAIWSCWRSTREMKTTHSSNAPPKSSWCSLIRLRPAMRVTSLLRCLLAKAACWRYIFYALSLFFRLHPLEPGQPHTQWVPLCFLKFSLGFGAARCRHRSTLALRGPTG